MKKKIAALFVVEKGLLEQQGELLANSIKKFCPQVDAFSFSPRREHTPSQAYLKSINKVVQEHFSFDLNQKHKSFPLANTLYAANFFETNFPEYGCIALIDTDTVFTNTTSLFFKSTTPSIHVRVVDNKGVGTCGPNDKNDAFWFRAFQHFNLPLPPVEVVTSIRQETIRPYYNSGFTLVKNIPGFFQQWLNDFTELMESKIRPEFVGRDGTNFGFFEQFALAITTARYPGLVKPLPENVNYPIPFQPLLRQQGRHIPLEKLAHIHYHKWFQHPEFLENTFTAEEQMLPVYQWLNKFTPFSPRIDGPLKFQDLR